MLYGFWGQAWFTSCVQFVSGQDPYDLPSSRWAIACSFALARKEQRR